MDQLLKILADLQIEYSVLEHEPITTMEQGKEIIKKLQGNVCLNLLVKSDDKYYLVIKKMGEKVDLDKLTKILNLTKKLKVSSPSEMTNQLKVTVGCANVFAIMNNPNITILIDSDLKNDKVNFHPMRNDATMTITFDDMLKYINHFGNTFIYY